MDDYKELSEDAKQAWQRGYDLAHPTGTPRYVLREGPRDQGAEGSADDVARAVDAVAAALHDAGHDAGQNAGKSVPGLSSGARIQMVVMDPVSVEAVIGELDNMKSDECKEALGRGFLRGMIAKARAARATGRADDGPLVN